MSKIKSSKFIISALATAITVAFILLSIRFLVSDNETANKVANIDMTLFSPISTNGAFVLADDGQLIALLVSGGTTVPAIAMENVLMAESIYYDAWAITKDSVLWRLDLTGTLECDYIFTYTKIMDEVVSVSASLFNGVGFTRSDGSMWVINSRSFRRGILSGISESEIELALKTIPQLFDDDYDKPILFLQNVYYACMENRLAIKNDGSLWVWGDNTFGQLGDGTTYSRILPVKVMDNVYTATGRPYRVAIRTDGSLWAWGRNRSGQLGDGTAIDRDTPTRIMDNVRQVAIAGNFTMAVTNCNTLWAWGANYSAQLGDGTTINRHAPVRIMDNIAYIVAGDWDGDGPMVSLAISTTGELWSWGYNEIGEIGDGTKIPRLQPVMIMDDVVYAMSGWLTTAAVRSDGSLWVWGGLRSQHLQLIHDDRYKGINPEMLMTGVRLSMSE